MKGEVLNVMNRAKVAETNLTDQHKLTEVKEKELSEVKNKLSQYEQKSLQLSPETSLPHSSPNPTAHGRHAGQCLR